MTDVPLPMDPRIRERRLAVQRDLGRRRSRALLAAAAALAVLGAAYGATRSPLLDVDTVRVRGAVHTEPATVAAAGGLAAHPQLADIDPAVVAAAVERLPRVETASVVRRWPGTVEITLTERSAVAVVPTAAAAWALVDRTGRVLDAGPEVPAEMVRIEGGSPAPVAGEQVDAATEGALTVLSALPEPLAGRVARLRLAGDQVDVVLRSGPVVRFGPATDIRAKVIAAVTLLERADLRGVKGVDVRVPTAPVLTRTEPSP